MALKKFKAVTKEGNIIDVASIQFMEDGSCIVNDEFPIAEGKLIQYTGLKDKNGKEIYEGDIIKSRGMDFEEENFEVLYLDGGFCARSSIWPSTYSSLHQQTISGAEIIGNIYENPELLK